MNETSSKRYGISARDYLRRAKKQLLEGSSEALFYAALELRGFVEARQDEYLDAQKAYAKSIPKAYKIGAQGKSLERIFSSSLIQHTTWSVEDRLIFEGHHVPVSKKMRNEAENLGGLLHAQMKFRPPDHDWWADTRNRVLNIYCDAWKCSQGNMLSPLLMREGGALGNLMLEVSEDLPRPPDQLKAGAKGILGVKYLQSAPESWVCDIQST